MFEVLAYRLVGITFSWTLSVKSTVRQSLLLGLEGLEVVTLVPVDHELQMPTVLCVHFHLQIREEWSSWR